MNPPLPRLRRTGFVEDFFFIYWDLGLCEEAFSRSRDAVGLALRGVDALDSRDLKMQERPF